MRSMFRPRRLVLCLALFVLLAGVGTAIAGVQQSDEVFPDLPAKFQVVPPYDGDRGGYTFTVYRDGADGLRAVNASAPAFELIHKFRPWFVDGRLVQVEEIGEFRDWGCSFNGKQVTGYQSDLFLADGTVIGNGQGCGHLDDPILSNSAGMDWRLASDQYSFGIDDEPRINALFCGQRSLFQQGPVDVRNLPSDLIGRCEIHYQPSFAPPAYRAIGTAPYGTETALVIEGLIGQPGHQVPTTWWFVPSIPYPVKWVYHDQVGDLVVFELAWLIRGTPPVSPPEITLLPMSRQPWGKQGPAEDVVHSFPLSQAIGTFRNDPRDSSLRDYEAAHPGAVVQQARVRDFVEDSRHVVSWSFVLADGPDYQGFSVSHQTSRIACLPGPPTVLPRCIPVDKPTGDDQYPKYTLTGATFPPASDLPSVPSVAQLYETYRALTGQQANAWGMDWCAVVCDENGPYLTVGRANETKQDLWDQDDLFFPGNYDSDDVEETLYLRADGTPVALRNHVTLEAYGPLAKEPDEPAVQRFDHRVGATEKGAIWGWHLSPAQTVGSVIGAAIVAAGVYIWPAIKGGLFGLFSRVEAGQLLEHPRRQTIAQQVRADPGIHLQELARRTGLGMSVVRHHVVRMRRGGVLRVVPSGRYLCLFPMETPRSEQDRAVRLRSAGAKAVAAALAEQPEASPADLARRTGLSEGTVRYHLGRMRA